MQLVQAAAKTNNILQVEVIEDDDPTRINAARLQVHFKRLDGLVCVYHSKPFLARNAKEALKNTLSRAKRLGVPKAACDILTRQILAPSPQPIGAVFR